MMLEKISEKWKLDDDVGQEIGMNERNFVRDQAPFRVVMISSMYSICKQYYVNQ